MGEKLFKFSDGLADGGFIEDLFLFKAARNESGGADSVDLAGEAAGVVKDLFKGIITKRGSRNKTCDAEMMLDVFNRYLEVEGWDMVSIGKALSKSFMNGKVKGLIQNRRAYKEQGTQRTAVHVGGEQETELLKGEMGKEMSLVNNKEGITLFGADEFVKSRADASYHFRFGKHGFIAEGEEDVAKKAAHAQSGVGEIDDQVTVRIQGSHKTAHSGGLAGTNLTGYQANTLFTYQVRETCGEFGLAGSSQDILWENVFGKRNTGETIKLLKHIIPPEWGVIWQTEAVQPVSAARTGTHCVKLSDNRGMIWAWAGPPDPWQDVQKRCVSVVPG